MNTNKENITTEFVFHVATEYPSTKDSIYDDITNMIKNSFSNPNELENLLHHKLTIKIIVEDNGWGE